jgi:hypothetical protein
MIERARRALVVYVELGPDRTLAKVSQAYAERGQSLPLVTLKRWSARFHWRSFIEQHERVVAHAFAKRLWDLSTRL